MKMQILEPFDVLGDNRTFLSISFHEDSGVALQLPWVRSPEQAYELLQETEELRFALLNYIERRGVAKAEAGDET